MLSRWTYDLDLLRRQAKQPYGLDQFQALVHQARTVDRDLCSHAPVGVTQCVGFGLAAQLVCLEAKERPAGCGKQDLCQAFSATLG